MVAIYDVKSGSPADLNGIRRGDYLVRINGKNINDVLDYRYYLTEKKVNLLIHRGPEIFEVMIEKPQYADIGLEFENFLMDDKRSCRNKCIFCFIDQLPRGMRDSLYFKDDDSRMSFLMGNYITMTNMSDEEIDRIIRMKTSPVNISVHTTNPQLRQRMLSNKNADRILNIMKRFSDAGIEMHCQIVLCRGINDSAELDRTMRDLEALYPAVSSVSVVPAGLTKYRENLYPLTPYSAEECTKIIFQVTAFAEYCKRVHGSRIFFLADELYIKADLPIPPEDAYENYPQIENGVGLIRSMKEEFNDCISELSGFDLNKRRDISIATGEAAYEFICSLVDKLKELNSNLICRVYKVTNNFFGSEVTVAGLITGRDIYHRLRGKKLGNTLYLPSVMLRRDGDMFLDDMTPAELERKLDTKIIFVDNNGYDFVRAILN